MYWTTRRGLLKLKINLWRAMVRGAASKSEIPKE
jgi:hypothetical protein